jgi:hypothetical protein
MAQIVKLKNFLSTRDRSNELAETKLKCPFRKRDGSYCTALLPFRHLASHCLNVHEQKVGIKCLIDDCWWWCYQSLRCLTSHLSNTETHGALVIEGGPNLDGRVEVIPYEIAAKQLKEHTLSCMVSKQDLCRFRGKMLKRNERAVAARMAESEVEIEIVFPPIKIEQENLPLPFNSEQDNLPLPFNSEQDNLPLPFNSEQDNIPPSFNSEQENLYPSVKSEKENFANFGNQVKEMMSKVTGVFTDWEGFENLMRANNMRYCKPTLN